MGRGKDKRTIEKKQQFIEQMNHFMIHDQLKFVNLKGHKTNLIISSSGVLYELDLEKFVFKVLKPYLEKDGHLRYSKKINGKDVKETIHKMVTNAFIPNPENKPEVHHKDGDELNNDVTNLMWVTRDEHAKLTAQLNQYIGNRGSFNGKSTKYTDEQIELVCKLLEENELYPKEICKAAGISYSEFQHIVHRPESWSYIKEKYNISEYNKFQRLEYTDEQKNEFIKIRNEHPEYTLKYISNLMNIRYETIKTWNVRYNKKRSTTRES